jgi:hypothetical protein
MTVLRAGLSSTSNDADANPMIRNKNPFSFIQPGLVNSFIIFWLLVLAAGCASPSSKLGSSRVAAVVIKDSTPDTIKASVKSVFEKHGFESAPEDENELVFEKKASAMNSFVYGDWFSGVVWARARLYLAQVKSGGTMLDCDVYMVQDPDDPLFQKERKVNASRTEFQKLLDEIKQDAEGNAPAAK